jgi:hypothetical protein
MENIYNVIISFYIFIIELYIYMETVVIEI